MDEVQLSKGCRATTKATEPLLFTFKFPGVPGTQLIYPTSEGWKTELTLEPLSGFEPRTPGLEIQHLNHQAIAPWSEIYVDQRYMWFSMKNEKHVKGPSEQQFSE